MLGVEYDNSLRLEAMKVKHSSQTQPVRKADIQNSLDKHMIEELQRLINVEVHSHCYGCQVDHPSQNEHPVCLFMDRQEHTELFLEKAICKLNPYDVLEKWYPDLQELKLNEQETSEAYKLWYNIKMSVFCGFSDSWLESWREKVLNSWES